MWPWLYHASLALFFLTLTGCQSVMFPQLSKLHCEIVKSEIAGDGINVKITTYASREKSERAILLYPPTGGSNFLDRQYATKLCLAGFDVTILESWTGDTEPDAEDLGLHHRLYSKSLKVTEMVLKQIPHKFVGVLGTSVGATYIAVAMNLIERFDAAFIIVGGAPMPEVIVNSDQGAMQELKQKRYKKYGFKNDSEYLAALDKEYPLDPFKTPPLFKNKTLGMIYSSTDTTVPAATQIKLKELWQPQTVYEFSNSHFWTIVKSWMFHQNDIVEFFIAASEKKPQ